MSLENDWLTFGSTSVNIAPLSTHDDYGNPVYGANNTYDCLIEYQRRTLWRPNGQSEQSIATLYVLSTSLTMGLSDQVTLPNTTQYPRVLQVDHPRDESGQHHVEVVLG